MEFGKCCFVSSNVSFAVCKFNGLILLSLRKKIYKLKLIFVIFYFQFIHKLILVIKLDYYYFNNSLISTHKDALHY